VGCGEGPDLLFLLWLGFAADNLAGIDLRPEVIEKARQRLPTAVDLRVGDATTAGFDPESFDIVQQVTVFSSLLADDSQVSLAHWMWNLVKPGGGIIWYDFIYDNPMNTDVRGVSLKRLRELFPGGEMSYRRVTLAPPISRFVCRIHPMSYGLLNSFSFLRTHVLCWIAKPSMVIRCK
jgi:2-polyprenyl-3-methyl-5-hydroxy-6-metoxy-1,4-benzoquinol methylase